MGFNCTGCGICCTKVKSLLDSIDTGRLDKGSNIEAKKFPYKAKKDGSCEMFEDNKCKVYHNRPNICNVETMYKKYHINEMSKEEYFKKSNKSCNFLMKLHNVPEKFHIKDL